MFLLLASIYLTENHPPHPLVRILHQKHYPTLKRLVFRKLGKQIYENMTNITI